MRLIRRFADKYEISVVSVLGLLLAMVVMYLWGMYDNLISTEPLWLLIIGVLFIFGFTLFGFIFAHWLLYHFKVVGADI